MKKKSCYWFQILLDPPLPAFENVSSCCTSRCFKRTWANKCGQTFQELISPHVCLLGKPENLP